LNEKKRDGRRQKYFGGRHQKWARDKISLRKKAHWLGGASHLSEAGTFEPFVLAT